MISNVTQTANGGKVTQITSAGVERLWFWEHPVKFGVIYIIKAVSHGDAVQKLHDLPELKEFITGGGYCNDAEELEFKGGIARIELY